MRYSLDDQDNDARHEEEPDLPKTWRAVRLKQDDIKIARVERCVHISM